MKCKICEKEIIDVSKEKYYEIDIYKYNQGINLNYSHEIVICKECFDKVEWLKEKKDVIKERNTRE